MENSWIVQIEKMIGLAREQVAQIVTKIDDYKNFSYEEIAKRQTMALSEIAEKKAILEDETAKLNKLRGQINAESDDNKNLKDEADKLMQELDSKKAQMANWNNELTKREADLTNLRNSLKAESSRINKLATDTQALLEATK